MHVVRCFTALAIAFGGGCGDDDGGDPADAGDGDASSSRDASSDVDSNVRPVSSFELLDEIPEACPLSARNCKTLWPPSELGSMTKFTSRETYGTNTWERTFHVYRPNRARSKPYPVVIFLHGGGGNGLQRLELRLQELADDRGSDDGIAWRKNTEVCRYTQLSGFQSVPEGKPCSPEPVTFYNELPFTLVLPDGVPDIDSDDARHWEDGRVPSPGHRTTEEQRNDVGFINHVLDVLLTTFDSSIDPERMYVMGNSNGGMMTQRLACNVTAPEYPHVQQLAAFAAAAATMPAGIVDGSDGRERCPDQGDVPLPIAYFVGDGIQTPNCGATSCDEPTSGDGIMPFGEPGGRYNVFAVERGLVVAAEDAHAHWIDYNAAAGGGTPTTVTEDVGFFVESRTTTFASSDARVHVIVSDGGPHSSMGGRMDIHVPARMWQFVSSFRREASGNVVYADPSHVSGTF